MADPAYPDATPAMLVAGDDAEGKETVLELAREIGFDAVDAGPLSAARDLEHLAMIWIRLAYSLGNGPGIAFALLRR
jgi:predicted dinucleotide-binding enzyme